MLYLFKIPKMAKIDEEMKTRFTNDQHRFLSNIVFTGNWIRNRFSEYLKPYGISNPQFNILRILRGAGDWLSMHEIKNRMVEKSPNTTRLSDKLVDKELVERQRCDEDRRVVYLRISEKGKDLLQIIDEDDDGSRDALMYRVSDREAQIVSNILDKLRE